MQLLKTALTGWRWPAFALAASAAMLAGAHAFETFGGLPPCPLCLRQREVYWALIAMTLTGLAWWRLVPKRRFLVALNVLIGLVFGVGVVVAAYHAGVEWQIFPAPAGCSVGDAVDPFSLDSLDQTFHLPICNLAPFYFLGLSMAGWNAVISAVLSGVSFAAAGITYRNYRPA
jgi:disulfide bond formation protein DsbB